MTDLNLKDEALDDVSFDHLKINLAKATENLIDDLINECHRCKVVGSDDDYFNAKLSLMSCFVLLEMLLNDK